jgi:hypothetical protein
MGEVIGWRVWYSDRVLSSKERAWEDLPADDVQCVMLYHADGTRRIMLGNDFYWRWESPSGVVYGHADSFDRARYPGAVVLGGKWTSDENLARIQRVAMESKVL